VGKVSAWRQLGGAAKGLGREGKLSCVSSFFFSLIYFFVSVFVSVGSSLFSSFGSFLYQGKQTFLKNNKRRGGKKSLPPPQKKRKRKENPRK
jgi:hypothetical protein